MNQKNNRGNGVGGSIVSTAIGLLVAGLIIGLISAFAKITLGAIPIVLLCLICTGAANAIFQTTRKGGSSGASDKTPDKATEKATAKSKPASPFKKQPEKSSKTAKTQGTQISAPLTVESAVDNKKLYIFHLVLAFSIPFLIMLITFAISGATPFGKNQIHATDLWHQYYPFMVDYQDKLQEGGSLLWTWKSGGGTNFIALMSYYLASPLNFLTVLIPADWLNGFLTISTCVKIGLAGLFFAMFLKMTFKRKDVSIAAFGSLYALCAFIMGYYWNVIWLDTIALLPLVIAGAIALLREGKWKLYVLSLGLSILANYYIGLFTCIFVALVAIGYIIVEYKVWKNLLINFGKMVGCSLLGVAMSAILTVPAYLALQHTHSSDNSFPSFAMNMGLSADFNGILQGIGKTIGNSVAFLQPTEREGLPNVYSGVIVIFLAILFFFCSKIKIRERVVCGFLLLFFTLSFIIRPLDYLWHGMHFPNMLPHRFSFLYTFVIIYMAFRVFMHIDYIKPLNAVAAICGFALYLGIAASNIDLTKAAQNTSDHTLVRLSPIFSDKTGVDPIMLSAVIGGIIAAWVLLYSLRNIIPKAAVIISAGAIGTAAAIFVFANGQVFNAAISKDAKNAFYIFLGILILLVTVGAVLLLSSKSLNSGHQMTKTVLSIILLLLALTEGLFSAASGVKTNGVTDTTTYPLGKYDTLACVEAAKEMESNTVDLPRTEVSKYHTLNDNALIGADGISMFNSMTNKDVTAYMEKFGICGWIAANRYTYQESSPLTNMLLNVKYIISPKGTYLDSTHNELVFQSNEVKMMRAKYYLPMGFMVKKDVLDFDTETAPLQPMANQNRLFNLITGLNGDVYEFITPTLTEDPESTAKVNIVGDGSFSYSSQNSSEGYDITYTAPRDGVATAYFSTYYSDNCSIRVNGAETVAYYTKRPFIMMVGDVKAGDTISLHCDIKNSSSGNITAYCAMFNDDLFTKGYNLLKLSTFKAEKITDTELEGTINAREDGLFYTSISYSPGWKAYVDGVETEITPIGGSELAFSLSAGTHRIKLTYMPEGFIAGTIITVLSILIFVGLIFFMPRRKKVLEKVKSRIGSNKVDPDPAVTEKESDS